MRVLNRVLRWTLEGIAYEPDQRHAELVVKELGLEGCKAVTSPWTTAERDAAQGESSELSTRDATKYRAVAARLNYWVKIAQICNMPPRRQLG